MSLISASGAPLTSSPKDPLEGLTDDEKALLEQQAEKADPTADWPVVTAAFAVIIDVDGQVSLDESLVTGVKTKRGVTNADVIGALNNLLSDIAVTRTALETIGRMQMQAEAMQRQMQDNRLTQQVQSQLQTTRR